MRLEQAYASRPAAVLRFSGEDHAGFLHNLATRDLQGAEGFSRYTLWLDHQGAIRGDGFILKTGPEEMLLVSYDCPAVDLVAWFEKYIIADDVAIDDQTDQWELVSVPPGKSGLSVETDTHVREGKSFIFEGRRLGPGSVDIIFPNGKGPEIKETLSSETAMHMRLEAGIPLVPGDTAPGSLNPVECGILSAVSFDKGCYLGQEVVARVHRLQRLTKRLVRIRGDASVPEAGTELLIGGKTVGALSSIATTTDGYLAIAWLKAKVGQGEQVFDSLTARVEDLPQT